MRTAQRWISVTARARPRTVTAGGEPGLPTGLPVRILEAAAAAGKSRPTGGPRWRLIPGHRNAGVYHQALVPLLGRWRGRLRVWGVMMGGTAVKGPLLALLALIALCVSSVTAASRPLGHCHMAAQQFTVESGVMMMVMVTVSWMDELVLVKRDGRFGKIVRRSGAAPAAATAPAAAPAVPTRRVVHNHDGAVDVAAGTAGFATGLSAAAGAAAAGAYAAAVRVLLLLLRMVVVVVVMVGRLLLLLAVLVVLREHRCRCRSGCCAIAITFALPADRAAGSGRRRRRGRFRSGGGWVAVLPAAPVGTAATLSAGGKTHVSFYTAYSRLPIGISLIALILLLLLFKFFRTNNRYVHVFLILTVFGGRGHIKVRI
jgi:hypothetical protein